ncbi:hypothetical protein [Ensifer sesbaniae]|uniref:hypothetical protein n=1 Tax=Ensifer sesbaniae TaxID=1214071 RepID=UPI00156809C8|nr:hypothetical protein [Ensifer sesbaniae]
MGFADIALPAIETTLRGVALARHGGQIIAIPPKVPGAKPGDLAAISWNSRGEFASKVCDVILEGYAKMGGEMPPASPERAETRANALRRLSAKPSHQDDEQDDDSGLRRLLGVGDAQ